MSPALNKVLPSSFRAAGSWIAEEKLATSAQEDRNVWIKTAKLKRLKAASCGSLTFSFSLALIFDALHRTQRYLELLILVQVFSTLSQTRLTSIKHVTSYDASGCLEHVSDVYAQPSPLPPHAPLPYKEESSRASRSASLLYLVKFSLCWS